MPESLFIVVGAGVVVLLILVTAGIWCIAASLFQIAAKLDSRPQDEPRSDPNRHAPGSGTAATGAAC